jgi:hypothetical protein
VLLGAGIVGYAFNKLKFQLPPLVVGLILGPNIEKHFREALFLSQGDPWIYVESPIAITVWLLSPRSCWPASSPAAAPPSPTPRRRKAACRIWFRDTVHRYSLTPHPALRADLSQRER